MATTIFPGTEAAMAQEQSFFTERLKQLRHEAGLTQEQLARRAGLSLGAIRHFEQGWREPAYGTLLALAEALGVSLAAFEPQRRKKRREK
jgi:transcriptional regulator with XRE-family HTH domain